MLFSELGNGIADQGWVRYPAYTPEDRRRLVDVAHRLTAHRGRQVRVEAEDQCRLRLCLAGHEARPEELPEARPEGLSEALPERSSAQAPSGDSGASPGGHGPSH